jgi:hypothetical protein
MTETITIIEFEKDGYYYAKEQYWHEPTQCNRIRFYKHPVGNPTYTLLEEDEFLEVYSSNK